MRAGLHRRWPAMVVLASLAWLAATAPAVGWEAAVRPVDGPVVRGFDPPDQPWLAGHRGVDLQAEPGTAVRAAAAGRIGFAGEVAGKPVVTVLHDGVRTTYEPVRASVAVGDRVSAGEMIGRLAAGHDCGGQATTCLHLGLLRGETYLDPRLLFEHPEIRLLSEAEATAISRRG